MIALDEAAVVDESITTTNDCPVLSVVANDSSKKNLRMKLNYNTKYLIYHL